MKLTDLLWRARKRAQDFPDAIETLARSDSADRSSMADLVRLLKEADDAQKGNVQSARERPA